jgi:hypothetical protein
MRHQVEKRGRADPVAFVYAGWRFDPDTVSDHPGILLGAIVSFTLFGPTNPVVIASLLICALSFAAAIFLVLELDSPFTGLMGISSATLRNALCR